MGHFVGISDSCYYVPNEKDLLEENMKVLDALTISNENRRKLQVEVLVASTKETEQLINPKLSEKINRYDNYYVCAMK